MLVWWGKAGPFSAVGAYADGGPVAAGHGVSPQQIALAAPPR
ncbi:hypothetical protein [Longispora fulva]|uniref:Uncharacterized protein n=1 Tax=Longispora fulva TaxID=619741 RepID=A0A8J7GER4_9ACTN|nr:hypothetical protein [Longispora fulva]MBG6136376.1 hypothetical protein [Longispora fulva]